MKWASKNKGILLTALGAIWAIMEVLGVGFLTPEQRIRILEILQNV